MAEPFTPRFVDLVRNTTHTTGTGNFVLGPAVSGFTSFTSAVSAGDRFYYCAVNNDKAAEREVGRGTMQSDGTIAREPVQGSLVGFTSGNKTLSLIAAAEWFSSVQASAAAPAPVASKSALASLGPKQFPAVLTERGCEGLFVFESSNLTAKVSADTRQGLHVAPASDPSGASGAWVRKFSGSADVRWFGAVGDGVTDDGPAFIAALAALPDHGSALYVPTGKYRLSQTLHVTKPVQIIGEGIGQNPGTIDGVAYSGADIYHGTRLIFDAGVEGIVFHSHTTEDSISAVLGNPVAHYTERSSLRSSMSNLFIASASVGGGYVEPYLAGHNGIRIKTIVFFENIWLMNFGDCGFKISAGGSINSQSNYGNADGSTFKSCLAYRCGNDGWKFEGGDAQVCTLIGCDGSLNGGWGFNDEGFLGNTYIACHAMGNNRHLRADNSDPDGYGKGSFRSSTVNTACTYVGCYIEADSTGEITDLSSSCVVIGGIMGSARYFAGTPACMVINSSTFLGDLRATRHIIASGSVQSTSGRFYVTGSTGVGGAAGNAVFGREASVGGYMQAIRLQSK